MAKNTVGDWSTTAGDNSDVGGINIAENCPAANMNNAAREMMAQVATLDPIGVASTATVTGTLTFTGTVDLSGSTLTMPTELEVLNASSITGLSGSDVDLITGTAGTSGDLAEWNADGDIVDGPTYGTAANNLLQLDSNGKVPSSATPFSQEYVSTAQTMGNAVLHTLAHGFGTYPKLIRLYAICTIADQQYSVGDRFDISSSMARGTVGADDRTFSVTFDTTNIVIRNGNDNEFANTVDKTSGDAIPLRRANWELYVMAWA